MACLILSRSPLTLGRLTAMLKFLRLQNSALGELDAFWDVDHPDRARSSTRKQCWKASCSAERQILDGFDQIIVFGARPGDADGVALLKSVIANQMRRHLPSENDDRD